MYPKECKVSMWIKLNFFNNFLKKLKYKVINSKKKIMIYVSFTKFSDRCA